MCIFRPRDLVITLHHHHGCVASKIDREPPWVLLFADDLVLCEPSKAAVERDNWTYGETNSRDMDGESAGQKQRTCMPCNDYDNNSRNYEELQLGDDKMNTVTTFKYLRSIFDSSGGAERDISNRVTLAWMKWKQLTGVLCDTMVPIKLKDLGPRL